MEIDGEDMPTDSANNMTRIQMQMHNLTKSL